MTSKARTSIAVLFGVVMVTRAFGTFGSVISSFKMTGAKPPYARGIYRDSTYVYGVLYGSPCSLRCYTTNGSVVGSVVLSGALFPGDADGTQTGAKYLAVLESKTMVRVYAIATGSFVTSFSSPTTWGYAYYPNNYPPGPSVYYGRGSYVEVYTVGGSFVNSFPVRNPRGLAATYTVGMVSGNYVIVGSAAAAGATRVYTAGGSLRASFTLPGITRASVCGWGAPMGYGVTYWAIQEIGDAAYAYQVDILGTAAVTPASLGKIKALFR